MTTTRADREAAVLLYRMNDLAAPDDPTDLAAYAEWVADPVGASHVSRGERKRLDRYASHFAEHRAASTQALREAAERLCVVIDAFDDGSASLETLFDARDALRSALAAETSGRDGGGNG